MNEQFPTLENPENNERSPAEQKEHLNTLAEMVKETGFVETADMQECRDNIGLWSEKANQIVNTAEKDSNLRKKLFLGYLISLAAIHYEKRNRSEYFENIDYAVENAWAIGLTDLVDRIEALE